MSSGNTLHPGPSVKRALLQLSLRGMTFAQARESHPKTSKSSIVGLLKQLRDSGWLERTGEHFGAIYTATPEGISALNRVQTRHPKNHQKLRGRLTKEQARQMSQPATMHPECKITRAAPTPDYRFAVDAGFVGAFEAEWKQLRGER